MQPRFAAPLATSPILESVEGKNGASTFRQSFDAIGANHRLVVLVEIERRDVHPGVATASRKSRADCRKDSRLVAHDGFL